MDNQLIKAQSIRILVLDEADLLCKNEFLEQIHSIYTFLKPEQLQVLFFSATYSPEEIKTISYIVKEAVEIDLRNDEYTLQGIKQYFINLGSPYDSKFGGRFSLEKKKMELCLKVQTLINVLRSQPLGQMMIFARRKADAQDVFRMLEDEKFQCALISSDLNQEQRNDVISEFKNGKKRILVTSDICKRGIDVQGLSVVICLDVPAYDQKEDFIHRVGRAGRYGKRGIALHILNQFEYETLAKIAGDYRTVLEELPKTFSFSE
ncbi:IF4A [Enterospora canceri]|uniref:RNA helicase n=1 Tax=Enterospora canceri TaxID=1081671 RepID=A0A1Y1S7K0_9MICR|nr:IF4A [Enterospora canceri]